jgi:hypothetical protein
MKRYTLSKSLAVTAVLVLIAGCSAPTPEIAEKVVTQSVKEVVQATAFVEGEVTIVAEPAEEVPAPLPTASPALTHESGQPGDENDRTLQTVAYRPNRMLIKNDEMRLLVDDTDVAIDGVTQIAADTLGYILSVRTWYQEGFKYATMTIGVPVNEFENALRRLRALGLKVQDENASGTDVTDQYVDLESRLRNLEATEARIRTFLDKALTVEESLEVNQKLAEITAQIEQVKGQMNYLRDRSAYSTITVHLSPQIPTPTPSPTPTITPTPTVTPIPTATPSPTPDVWRPGNTFKSATGVLGSITRTLGDMLIWITVVFGPFALLVGLLLSLGVHLRRRWLKPE